MTCAYYIKTIFIIFDRKRARVTIRPAALVLSFAFVGTHYNTQRYTLVYACRYYYLIGKFYGNFNDARRVWHLNFSTCELILFWTHGRWRVRSQPWEFHTDRKENQNSNRRSDIWHCLYRQRLLPIYLSTLSLPMRPKTAHFFDSWFTHFIDLFFHCQLLHILKDLLILKCSLFVIFIFTYFSGDLRPFKKKLSIVLVRKSQKNYSVFLYHFKYKNQKYTIFGYNNNKTSM